MTTAQSQTVTPEVFFDEVVPLVFTASQASRKQAKISGTCEIALFDPGCTSWTLDLGKGTVSRERTEKPDLYMEMKREDFASMLAEELDVPAAAKQGRIRLQGAVGLLTTLSMLLRPRTLPY